MSKNTAANYSALGQAIIEEALCIAGASLHMTLCSIKADSLRGDDQRRVLAHISYMTSLIAHYSIQVDAARIVSCEECRAAVEKKMFDFER